MKSYIDNSKQTNIHTHTHTHTQTERERDGDRGGFVVN